MRYDVLWKMVSKKKRAAASPIHGLTHWKRVCENGLIVARETVANIEVVELFALFHDSCRLNDGKDHNHGKRAARWVASMRSDLPNLSDEHFQYLLEAIRNHTHVRNTDNIHIAACWDADRLDLGRVGKTPREEFMNTDIGRIIARKGRNMKIENTKDTLYNDFHDPSHDFLREPRAFCYELASNLINHAKEVDGENWRENVDVKKGIILLLYTWNFAAKETKKLNFENVGELIKVAKDDFKFLDKYSIENADDDAWEKVELIFDQFRILLGQTGASKALSLLNPNLFVMWDTAIRKRLNKELIPGIMNGERGEYYVKFLKGIKKIIEDYGISEKLLHGSMVAKKIDEYHYVNIVMNKPQKTRRRKAGEKKTNNDPVVRPEAHNKIHLPDNLRGRSIFEKVIPMVCNLKNMLDKLVICEGDHSKFKQWEKRSYQAYLIDEIKTQILGTTNKDRWKEIIRNHILSKEPSSLGASCIDMYLVAYVSENYGSGKEKFFQFIEKKGISKKRNVAQAIWQVGKGDGVFLDILNKDGTIKDWEFFNKWVA
jgi:hypothetical protein